MHLKLREVRSPEIIKIRRTKKKANLLKGRDAKLRIYSQRAMTAGLLRARYALNNAFGKEMRRRFFIFRGLSERLR